MKIEMGTSFDGMYAYFDILENRGVILRVGRDPDYNTLEIQKPMTSKELISLAAQLVNAALDLAIIESQE